LVVRLAVDWKLDCVHEPIAFYRQHGGNESYKHRSRFVEEMGSWLREMSEVESIRSCSNWPLANNNYIYHSAVDQVLLGNKKTVYGLSKELPWGKPKLKLLLSMLFPTYYILQRFRH